MPHKMEITGSGEVLSRVRFFKIPMQKKKKIRTFQNCVDLSRQVLLTSNVQYQCANPPSCSEPGIIISGLLWLQSDRAQANGTEKPLHACKWISNCLEDCTGAFRVNWQGSEIGRSRAKTLGYSPCSFEHGGLWQVPEMAPNSLKSLQHTCKWISNCLEDCSGAFQVNLQVSEICRFRAKTLGYSPCFWTWWIMASSGNHSKLPEKPPTCLQMVF